MSIHLSHTRLAIFISLFVTSAIMGISLVATGQLQVPFLTQIPGINNVKNDVSAGEKSKYNQKLTVQKGSDKYQNAVADANAAQNNLVKLAGDGSNSPQSKDAQAKLLAQQQAAADQAAADLAKQTPPDNTSNPPSGGKVQPAPLAIKPPTTSSSGTGDTWWNDPKISNFVITDNNTGKTIANEEYQRQYNLSLNDKTQPPPMFSTSIPRQTHKQVFKPILLSQTTTTKSPFPPPTQTQVPLLNNPLS